jgi:hypothetical protein
VETFNLTENESLSCLIYCLSGDANALYASLNTGIPHLTLNTLLMAFEEAYGDIESTELAFANFQMAEQREGESLQRWAERIRRLGSKAFSEEESDVKERRKIIEKFCMGMCDRSVGRSVLLNDHPSTLMEALVVVQRRQTIDIIYPPRKTPKPVRAVSVNDEEENFLGVVKSEIKTQTPARFRPPVSRTPTPPSQSTSTDTLPNLSNFMAFKKKNPGSDKLLSIPLGVLPIDDLRKLLAKCLQLVNNSPQSSSASPTQSAFPASRANVQTRVGKRPGPGYTCHTGGSMEHFRRECPKNVCYNCGSSEHFKRDCPQSRSEK